VTETTAAVAADLLTVTEPSPHPLAEEVLLAHPGVREFYADRDAIAALEAPPSVTVESHILSAFDSQQDMLARGYDADRALVGSWYHDAYERTHEVSRAVTATSLPPAETDPDLIEGEIIPDDPGAAEAQHDATLTLARWGVKPEEMDFAGPPDAVVTDLPGIHHEDGDGS
jgi:hypothetical protein